MSIYKLLGAGTGGTEDSIASLDIQFDGVITAIHMSLVSHLDADDESIHAEASFLSGNTVGINDARGSLMTVGERMTITTSGVSKSGIASGVSGLNIPVTGGERVHLHVTAAAGVVSTTTAYLYVDDGAATDLRRRR